MNLPKTFNYMFPVKSTINLGIINILKYDYI